MKSLIFRQLFDTTGSSTYTYLIACTITKEALLIDPVLEQVERDTEILKELKLTLKYVINTHCHADHVTGTGLLKSNFPDAKSVISINSGAKADIHLNHLDKIHFGDRFLEARATPGHTNGCMCFLIDDLSFVITGDALMIRGCGRCDFQDGSTDHLYESVHSELFTLPDDTSVYPGHDYHGRMSSTILEEKTLNPRLSGSLEDFNNIMNDLHKNLSYPKFIDIAIPRNLNCGLE